MATDAEAGFVDYAATLGLTDEVAVLTLVRVLVGDVNRKPIMWTLECPIKHETGHTCYEAVAVAYSQRPGYTVTPIYSHTGVRP